MLKKLLSITLLLFCCYGVFGQVSKFRTKQIAIKLLQENGEWSEWSDWEDSNSLITFNSEIDRITIHGEPNRTFDIITSEETTDDNGDKALLMNCIGANEDEVLFKMVYDKNYNLQFYIYYREAILVYNVISLD